MSYDKNGLGLAEISWCAIYSPNVFKRIEFYLSVNNTMKALQIARDRVNLFNIIGG